MGGSSLLNVTAFDAAYYADNMTVLFHLMGTTNLQNDSVMSTSLNVIFVARLTSIPVYISVEACKEAWFLELLLSANFKQMEKIVLTLLSILVMLISSGMSSLPSSQLLLIL